MQILDIHLHSKYSRACSKQLDLEHIEQWCRIKGIDLIGTSDFTHPAWFKEIQNKLEPQGNGLFRLKSPELQKRARLESEMQPLNSNQDPQFLLTTELSCIYSQGGKVRRNHILVCFPEISHVAKLIKSLEARGAKLASDGRPILGISSRDIAAMCLDISEQALIIPAHAWTPWFAVFGSKSGFDSVEECFQDYSQYIYALETGLSSDPAMNWRLSKNDKYTLISNSDAHSLENLGREANVLDLKTVSYGEIFDAIKTHDNKRFVSTIEFFPEEGKYHMDGCASCGFACEPEESKRLNERCPTCGKKITIGVYHRVASLADQPMGRAPEGKIPFKSIVPLAEILAESLGVRKGTKKVQAAYRQLINGVGSEFHILLDAPLEAIAQQSSAFIAEGIKRVREGTLHIKPGYDGVYGQIKIFTDEERAGTPRKQSSLF